MLQWEVGRTGNTVHMQSVGIDTHLRRQGIQNRKRGTAVDNGPLNLPRLDKKWQAIWHSQSSLRGQVNGAVPGKKMYILPMFPYPSGDLHLGHLRVYTISDVLARFRRMQGYDVMHPIGWDAFGLPAENAAIERGIDPATWTKSNIQKMKKQLEAMNGHWDWHHEFATCDPEFYKHTQQLFLLLHEHGLAYQAESLVNYDPIDKTVLANEQVDSNGNSWRSGAKVEKRLLKQWFLKISAFRQQLLSDLDKLSKDGAWPERVLAMQKNWIGKSTGARVKFPVVTYDQKTHLDIEVFTTRPDTLFGVQYLALAASHPIVQELSKNDPELCAFLDTIPALPQDSKVGYMLPHVRALNPLAYEESTPDATKASLPIYVAPYVLGDYGDGAVMGVPGHDLRDHSFWKHNRYDEPVRMVIAPSPDGSTITTKDQPYVHAGHLTHHSGPYKGHTTEGATKKIVALLQSKGLGAPAESWRLRDWLISRQRYWGTPIPIIHCDGCGAVPVPDHDLPVELPAVHDHWEQGKTGNPLAEAHDWVNTSCPKCGNPAKRDTDTMDTFVDSSWYFMRFPDSTNARMPFSPMVADASLPVDIYVGGVEHAILHLLYARFISKFMATTDLWPAGSRAFGEPFKKVLAQGMVHGKTFSDPSTGRFLKPNELDWSNAAMPIISATGKTPAVSFEKMSKSKYNGVDPTTCMDKYGADATRAHILFQAPVSEILEWDEEKISGITRWLRKIDDHVKKLAIAWSAQRHPPEFLKSFNAKEEFLKAPDGPDHPSINLLTQMWTQVDSNKDPNTTRKEIWDRVNTRIETDKQLWRNVQKTIRSITTSYGSTYALNTVVSDLMSLTNSIVTHDTISKPSNATQVQETVTSGDLHLDPTLIVYCSTIVLLKLMAPIAPAFAEECWANLSLRSSSKSSIFDESFPETDGTYDMLAPETRPVSIMVNGKLRCVLQLPKPPSHMNVGERDIERWMVHEILQTEEGKAKFMGAGKSSVDIRNAKRVIVAKSGKSISFVIQDGAAARQPPKGNPSLNGSDQLK